jgi:four helix bundle protein
MPWKESDRVSERMDFITRLRAGELADQLRRAALSIPLNIAEGAGKPSPNDRSRYHATARGSAMKCGAVLDLLGLLQLAHPETLQEGKNLLVRLVAMLTKMCR